MPDFSDASANHPASAPDTLTFDATHDDATDRDAASPTEWAAAHATRAFNEIAALSVDIREAVGLRVTDNGGIQVAYTAGRVRYGDGAPVDVAASTVNLTDDQTNYVEVWCEKDAVSNIIEPVCRKWDVIFMANRGYSSQSAMYSAYGRYQNAYFEDKDLHLIYFGDHDPSGIDMTRDIQDRMDLFLGFREGVAEQYITLGVDRAALNMDQVEEYDPPENPAKTTDSRYESYVQIHGDSSWELDALSPDVLSGIVEAHITEHVDLDVFARVEAEELQIKDKIKELADDWSEE